jgi:hypothetical protein
MNKNDLIQHNRKLNGANGYILKPKIEINNKTVRKNVFRVVMFLSDNFIQTKESIIEYIDYGLKKATIQYQIHDIKKIT